MNTYTCKSGRVFELVLGKDYEHDGAVKRRAGHVSITVTEPITAGKATVPGLVVNACPTWGKGRTIAIRGGESGGQARLAPADDLPTLVEILTEDIPELFGAWGTLGLEATVVTPAPEPLTLDAVESLVGVDALRDLLNAPVDPWQELRDIGADDALINKLQEAGYTPETALALARKV